MQDITIRHPQYDAFAESWRQVRDANAGEDDIKQAGERYLPMKSGQAAIKDPAKRAAAYNAYKTRAEFPEIVAPTIRGAVGVMLSKPATIDLPPQMEHLRERATLDGLTLDALHRRIAMEVMATGRYGLLPGLHDGVPYLSGYVAESIINWDSTAGALDFLVLDESGPVRDRATGQWSEVDRYRECLLDGGAFIARVWTEGASGWSTEEEPRALTPRKTALDSLPFVFIGSLDLTPAPDDVPLYGLAKLAVRAYRVDADRMAAIHLTCEGTPWVNGFNDAAQAAKDGLLPQGLGASALWVLPENATAGALEFSASGVQPAKDAFDDALERAAQFGAQIIQQGSAAESGEALKLRAASQTATLTTIAQTTAAGLEKALRNIAVWIGADPKAVIVTPNLDFFDRRLTTEEARAVWDGWIAGVYDWRTAVEKLKDGGWLKEDADPDEIEARLNAEGGDDLAGTIPPQPGAEGAITT